VLDDVAAIIVTFNGAKWVDKCLDSISRAGLQNVIVVDNGSTDATCDMVTQHSSKPRLLRLPQNIGFGRANNVGIQLALDAGADWTLLVNQDLTMHAQAAVALYDAAINNSDYGILSAFQLTYDSSGVDPAFFKYTSRELFSDLIKFGMPKRKVYECQFMPAACILVSRRFWLEVGGFDPLFFMYGEDDDLCARSRVAAFRVGVVPNALVNHWHGLLHCQRSLSKEVNFEYSRKVLEAKELAGTHGLVRLLARLAWKRVQPWIWKARLRNCYVVLAAWLRFLGRIRLIKNGLHQKPYQFEELNCRNGRSGQDKFECGHSGSSSANGLANPGSAAEYV
jgi:GT2 family glycosyltransferase